MNKKLIIELMEQRISDLEAQLKINSENSQWHIKDCTNRLNKLLKENQNLKDDLSTADKRIKELKNQINAIAEAQR